MGFPQQKLNIFIKICFDGLKMLEENSSQRKLSHNVNKLFLPVLKVASGYLGENVLSNKPLPPGHLAHP